MRVLKETVDDKYRNIDIDEPIGIVTHRSWILGAIALV